MHGLNELGSIRSRSDEQRTGRDQEIKAFAINPEGFDARNQGRNLAQWWPKVEGEVRSANGQRGLELKDLSMLQWRDSQETMVVTFGEVAMGQSRGTTKRQYWARENDQWKIFFEGTP